MQMDEGDARLLEPFTWRIIGCAFRVANALGHGFVERCTRTPSPTKCESAGSVPSSSGEYVFYDDVIVGEFTADLLVEDRVIVELKVVGALSDLHLPQSETTSERQAGPK